MSQSFSERVMALPSEMSNRSWYTDEPMVSQDRAAEIASKADAALSALRAENERLAREVEALRRDAWRWIPVDERLPLIGPGYVHNLLVVNEYGSCDTATWDGYAQYFEMGSTSRLGGHPVVAWQALPEPPARAAIASDPGEKT